MQTDGSALKCLHRSQPYGGTTRPGHTAVLGSPNRCPGMVISNTGGKVNRRDVLGGIVHEYERAAYGARGRGTRFKTSSCRLMCGMQATDHC